MLDAGADLIARDEHLRSTPLAWAAKFGQLEMVKFLLERGAPKSLPDDPPWATPLILQVRCHAIGPPAAEDRWRWAGF